jgi:hypothetical protein
MPAGVGSAAPIDQICARQLMSIEVTLAVHHGGSWPSLELTVSDFSRSARMWPGAAALGLARSGLRS